MMTLKKIYLGQNIVRVNLGVIFLLIGWAIGVNLLLLEGLGLIGLVLTFGLVGYMLPPILGKIGARAIASVIERLAGEVVKQLKELFRHQPLQRLGSSDAGNRTPTKEDDLIDQNQSCPVMIMDTSAIIDGRIGEIIKTGFLHGRVVVPKFVLIELQRIADSRDRLHRERGRRGLDLLKELQQLPALDLVIKEKGLPRGKDVDERLVKLAKKLGGQIVTTDFNLNKVAKLSKIKVLNVNELANALRPLVIPGETITIIVVQPGKEAGQGVGYFPDGTMVVVEDGGDLIGQEIEVVVSRFLQTAAGRMVFARKR